MKITKIYKIDNAASRNKHNNVIFFKQKLLAVEFEDGSVRYLDLRAKMDITDIDYFELLINAKVTKIKVLFEAMEI